MSSTERILLARRFALACHDDQKYGNLPYEVHLQKVVNFGQQYVTNDMLEGVATREQFEQACWMHDVLEDTCATKKMLEALFGSVVADAVFACTDVQGNNRHERKHGTAENPGPYIKLRQSSLGLIVKLCDRAANIIASSAGHRDSMLKKYKLEQVDFRQLRTEKFTEIWEEIERLLT